MSDDRDYEDLGAGDEPADDEGLGEAELESKADEEDADEVGLEEDAAGTDDEDEGNDEVGDDEAEAATQKARPERPKTDPISRMSNKPRFVQVVAPEDRITDNRLHKSEAAFVIAMRAQQIAKFATRFTESQEGPGGALHDPVELALKELLDRRCPFILRRSVGTGPGGELIVEEWAVRNMTLPPLTSPTPLGGGRVPAAARRS